MYCRNCGKQIDESSRFCKECGAPTTGDIGSNNNKSTNITNEGFSFEKLQGIAGQNSIWEIERLAAVIFSILTIFIPVLDFSAGNQGEKYSLWGLWGLVQKIAKYDQSIGAYFEEDIQKIKMITVFPLIFAVIAALFGLKYLYAVMQKKESNGKDAQISMAMSILTIVIVWVYARIMNDSLAEILDDFLGFSSFSGNGGVRLFSLTGLAIVEAAIMIFNIFYVLPQKFDNRVKWEAPAWMTNNSNSNFQVNDGDLRKRCPICGMIFKAEVSFCPRCKTNCSNQEPL